MNRQQKRKLLKEGEKIRKLRDQDFQEFLRVSCLSAIGNMDTFVVVVIALEGEDSGEVSGVFAKNAKQPVVFYHQNSEAKITKVSLNTGEDLTEDFRNFEKLCRERFGSLGFPESVLTFEVIKTMNFIIEKELNLPFGHLIFTDKSVPEMKVFTEEVFSHYDRHYGSKKPIYLAVYHCHEEVSTWH